MQTLYGYQVKPGSDETLFFSLTIEECRAAAIDRRREMRNKLSQPQLEPMAIYECLFRIDLVSLLEMLNNPDCVYSNVLLSKSVVEVVAD